MGFSVRAFLVNESGELERFSYARFQRLLRHDPSESLPGRAGAYVCFAIAYIDTLGGEPSQIEHVDYIRLKLGPDARLDKDAERRSLSLAAGSIDLFALAPEPENLIRAEHVFNRRQYQREFSWRPSRAQEQSLVRLIKEQWRRKPPR
jgi:hypothetical protein